MHLIDICGILVVIVAVAYGVWRIFGSRRSDCGCGGKKCSKPKHYSSKNNK